MSAIAIPNRRRPGEVRDAIVEFLRVIGCGASVSQIEQAVSDRIGGPVPPSSVRSYLRLNTPAAFVRVGDGVYALHEHATRARANGKASPLAHPFAWKRTTLYQMDCFEWLRAQPVNTIHGVVTDPPYGLVEYSPEEQRKLRKGRGGIWRIPPSYDGHQRSPLPRFTVLDREQLTALRSFFHRWAGAVLPVLVPGAHVFVASNPLLSYLVAHEMCAAGFERRGEVIRLTMTMRGGDRPKNAHREFAGVTVMPRSMWEPWLLFRKPIEGRVQDNLRAWKTGGLRRPSNSRPFGDVVRSAPTRPGERKIAPHPSLKPQAFLRQIVRSVLPLGEGTVLDPFAGSGSTLAACESVGYTSIGIESDPAYASMAREAIPKLHALRVDQSL